MLIEKWESRLLSIDFCSTVIAITTVAKLKDGIGFSAQSQLQKSETEAKFCFQPPFSRYCFYIKNGGKRKSTQLKCDVSYATAIGITETIDG